MRKPLFVWNLLFLSLLLGSPGLAESGRIDLGSAAWKLRGEAVQSQNVLGRPAIQIRTGGAALTDVRLQDGTIEFDMAVTRHRSFVYILFRTGEEGEQEEIYFRPHKSSLPDAIQYSPVYKGASNWQLYHGPGYTAAVDLEPDTWIPVRLVLQGRKGALFVGEGTAPVMLIPLARDPQEGGIAFGGFLPQGKPEGVYTASFSNLRVSPGVVSYDFSKAAISPPTGPAGTIREWSVSVPFEAGSDVIRQPPGTKLSKWTPFQTESSGLLLLGKHIDVPDTIKTQAVYARVVVKSEKDVTKQFNLGYSDKVSVFLNGKPLFSGDATYSFDRPRREGLIGLDQATLYLPLKKGDNELVLAVSDIFGGWGLMGQFPDQNGLTVTAR